ncbi:sensor histidine kinase [Velocimicrobium porci]|uniref:histidine kinase n=1 Tax=Velocimicrobium porci TaxID=2606634 RepID=A0A6L5Y1G0_9FIRM|nr:ATP-binding protein [Velocimicrobium porci]MSS64832.1 HAMP domain-containing protein [Velocimicrobium porci]
MKKLSHSTNLLDSLFFRIFCYFAITLSVFAFSITYVFMNLYRQNTLSSYQNRLLNQARKFSNSVSTYVINDDVTHFTAYLLPWQEMLAVENTDLWILPNADSKNALKQDYTNVNLESMELSKDTQAVIDSAIHNKARCITSYEPMYGKTVMRISTPIHDSGGNVIGVILLNSYLDNIANGTGNSKSIIITSILFGFIVSFLLAILFARQLARPVSQMRIAALEYADGNYSYTTNIRRKDEIGELANTLDVLAEKLTENEKERQYLEQMRLDFFANVSHELRTPITVVRGYTETLADGIVTDFEKINQYYQRILSECKSMERLVGDLLTLSKMQNPDFQVEKEPVNIVQIFDDVLRSTHMLRKNKRIHLDYEKTDEPILMLGDYDRLRQMFIVILDNAVKFSSEDSTIHVSLQCTDKIEIKIRDEGIGIAKEELPSIFDKFYKSKLRQNASGSGLGLLIAKQIALKHKGTIDVTSELGKGTEFTFTFSKESFTEKEFV